MTAVKICGLSTADTLDAALDAGADMVGFVFFAPSPRNVSLDVAHILAGRAKGRAKIVALTVDANDAQIDAIMRAVAPDAFQLHGSEQRERVAAIRARTGRETIKAIGVATARDICRAGDYRDAADTILFDAKAPPESMLPGGNGLAFDWTMLRTVALASPWMLSGGLDTGNVAEALRVTGAACVDVSSGVESAPGVKDASLIRAFIAAVRALSPAPVTG